MSPEKPTRPYGFCCMCAQAVSVNIHGGATQHWNVAHTEMCSGSELGMDVSIEARDQRIRNGSDWLARVKAEAAEEAAEDVSRMYAGTDGTDAEKAWISGVDAAARRIRNRAAQIRSGVK